MFTTISWKLYLTSIGGLLILFYTGVALYYFLKKRSHRLHAPQPAPAFPGKDGRSLFFTGNDTVDALVETKWPDATGDAFVKSLEDELNALFESEALEYHSKATLCASIKAILQNHPTVRGTPFQHRIINRILSLAEQKGSICLHADDVETIGL